MLKIEIVVSRAYDNILYLIDVSDIIKNNYDYDTEVCLEDCLWLNPDDLNLNKIPKNIGLYKCICEADVTKEKLIFHANDEENWREYIFNITDVKILWQK